MRARKRRRGRGRERGSFIGLDSFLDIVTNVIGALFFVMIYAALSAFGATGKITMPMAAPAETERILVECRGNTVFFTDADSLVAAADEVWARATREGLAFNARVSRLRSARIANAFYVYEPAVESSGLRTWVVDQLVQVPGATGEAGHRIRDVDSNFRRRLAAYDPEKHHIIFLTRVDSFEVFHTARSIALAAGFRVGWEPLEAGTPLRFGSGGRDIAVY